MLNALFGSDAKVKILGLFLLHPETRYEIPQIARDLKLTANLVRHEVEGLSNLGLINISLDQTSNPEENLAENIDGIKEDVSPVKKRGEKTEKKKVSEVVEKKYFKVDKNFILYPEIKALFIKAQILFSQKFISALEKSFQPKVLILTGFFTNYPEAQTDILIVGAVKRPPFLKMIAELEKDLDREINFTILEEKEFKYRQEIMDIFLYNILEGKSITLIDNLSNK